MSWILKQAEDILNRVDQQTNAALHQHTPTVPLKQNPIEFTSEISSYTPSKPLDQPISTHIPINRTNITPPRRTKKTDESDLINYLNSSTPITNNETKKTTRLNSKTRTNSSSSTTTDDPPLSASSDRNKSPAFTFPSMEVSSEKELIASLQTQIERLTSDKVQHENELQNYKRQQMQYQHQIAESDALLRDLHSRESDSQEVLSTKDSQIALLRIRLNESDQLLQTKTHQYDQLHNDYSRLIQDSATIPSLSLEFVQSRIRQLEQELERQYHENERLTNENEQLIEQLKLIEKQFHDEHLQIYEQQQQTKQAKNSAQQIEQEMNDYKIKAQRILQTKDKLIQKLKDIIQHRSSTPTIGDQHEIDTSGLNDDSTLHDLGNSTGSSSSSSNWASIQYEELQSEHELFKQELQAREFTIHTLRNDVQEAELLIQQTDVQYQEQLTQLNEQLKEKNSRLILAEQDCRKFKHELTSITEDFNKQKQMCQGQLIERERDIERLRLQLTAKTINHVNDDELEKRLQTLTESLIHKQTIIETLQTDKSSLSMQLERLEKRLDDYDTITAAKSSSLKTSPPTSIPIDDNEQYENLRYRMPLLPETPYDVDLTKKVKRAANQLDQLGVRLTISLRRYPAFRLAVLFYAIVLHLWTFFLLFTHTPEIHGNRNSIN